MSKETKKIVTIVGNLGGDPELKTFEARTRTTLVYDKILDGMVERDVTDPAKEFRTFSVAMRPPGEEKDHWVSCVDWENRSALCRKGDRVELQGYLHTRTYMKDGQEKTFREFRVTGLRTLRTKIRHAA